MQRAITGGLPYDLIWLLTNWDSGLFYFPKCFPVFFPISHSLSVIGLIYFVGLLGYTLVCNPATISVPIV